jgi:hypothetical protein
MLEKQQPISHQPQRVSNGTTQQHNRRWWRRRQHASKAPLMPSQQQQQQQGLTQQRASIGSGHQPAALLTGRQRVDAEKTADARKTATAKQGRSKKKTPQLQIHRQKPGSSKQEEGENAKGQLRSNKSMNLKRQSQKLSDSTAKLK